MPQTIPKLRKYQIDLREEARNLMHKNVRSILIQAPTGAGKTLLVAHMLKTAESKGMSAWFIVHRRELIKQSIIEFNKVKVKHGVIARGWLGGEKLPIQIASIQTLVRRYHKYRKPTLIIYDECFPAGTKVDGKYIEEIQSGNMVLAFNHTRGIVEKSRVVRTFKCKPEFLIKVKYYNRQIICTPDHPFYIKGKGYVKAKNLNRGDGLLSLVQIGIQPEQAAARSISQSRKNVLLKVMQWGLSVKTFFRNNVKNKQNLCFREDEEKQSYAQEAYKGKDATTPVKNWTRTNMSRREWKRTNGAAEINNSENKGIFSKAGILCAYRNWRKKKRLAKSLQYRHSLFTSETSCRDRRQLPLREKVNFGQEEGSVFDVVRVEGIENIKRTGDGTFGGYCPDGYVYNLEVEKNNNYFVDNVLVHNCHHAAAGSWNKLYKAFPNAFHIGLTATPLRLDGAGLKRWFSSLIKGPSVRWLIDNGFLADYKLYAPSQLNLSSIHSRMGDFIASEVSAIIDKPTITGDAIKHYQKLCHGKRAVVFCVSIEHSKHVVIQFNKCGIKACHVDGETKMKERDKAIKDFTDGKIKVLSNVDLFGEGFDLPCLEAVILLRPTKSLGLYLQQVGRSLRPSPGKKYAIILDHANNCTTHGLPDDDREWSLEGRKSFGNKKPEVKIKICPKCYAAQSIGKPACVSCGHVFEGNPRQVESVDGELTEVDPALLRRKRLKEQGRFQTEEELVQEGIRRGYRRARLWARHVMKARGQRQPARREHVTI